eukprot:Gb_39662 [translate_table: standard]
MRSLCFGDRNTSLINASKDIYPFEMDNVAALRNGEVLGRQTVLKGDHCPGCQNLSLTERLKGAPNFREVAGFAVYGVANPTVDGIRAVIQRVGGAKGGRRVLWHNTREEPVVYINGKPFVLREVERPYKNMLEYRGIERERVEAMEARLKKDVLKEAERYHGAIMVIDETEDGRLFDSWESVNPKVVQTPLEVFKSLEIEGFPIEYVRVPITDGKAPQSSDIDDLAIRIAKASYNTAFVFNCQMGYGRTTTGTVIACLVRLRIENGRPLKPPTDQIVPAGVDNGSTSGEESNVDNNNEVGSLAVKIEQQKPAASFSIDDIPLLRKITRLFDNGVECRKALDAIINRCAALQNIRHALLHYWKILNQQQLEPRVRCAALSNGAEYLERYFILIAFSAYLGSEAFDGFCEPGSSGTPFRQWLRQRPEVQEMKWSIRLRPARYFTVPVRTPGESYDGDTVMEAIVKSRNGSVLGKQSILKLYLFPEQKITSDYIDIPGTSHVYKFPIARVALFYQMH